MATKSDQQTLYFLRIVQILSVWPVDLEWNINLWCVATVFELEGNNSHKLFSVDTYDILLQYLRKHLY